MDMLIVESGAKSKTIQKYLGKGWVVGASNGHVQDLPNSRASKEGRKAMWAAPADALPNPTWEWTERSEATIGKLLDKAQTKGVENVYIATDPDREGEFIAWRLFAIFTEAGFENVWRITFNEITKKAVQEAIEARGAVDMNLVDAAKVRRFMDRLVGFRSSKFCRSWSLSSMGRVQTPTLGFVVKREAERDAFVPLPYFSVSAEAGGVTWNARFHETDDADVWIDDKGKKHPGRTNDEAMAKRAFAALGSEGGVTLDEAKEGKRKERPYPPFTTDALLQAAGARYSWNPRRTMSIAGELYNAGHITYIRTDSTRTNAGARDEIKAHIRERWGEDHIGPGVLGKDARGDAKNVQDAHEAIRPTQPTILAPEGASADQLKLYKLIWARFAGSQMSESRYDTLSMRASVDGFERPLTGSTSWRTHAGWEAAFEGIRKTPALQPPAFATAKGTVVQLDAAKEDQENPKFTQDETKPPARYKQHTLVKAMKDAGIGRPSTYAATIEKLISRKYASDEKGSLKPTNQGKLLWDEVAPHYTLHGSGDDAVGLFTTTFTADMEAMLDSVESAEQTGPAAWHDFSARFQEMHGAALERKKSTPTPKQLSFFASLTENLDADAVAAYTDGRPASQVTGTEMREIIDAILSDHPQSERPASAKQMAFVTRLCDEVEISEADACALVGLAEIKELTGGREGSANALIELLLTRRDSTPRGPSEKQMKWILEMADKAKLTQTEAAALVELGSLDDLTGGREGMASKLITILKKKTGGGRRGKGRKKKKKD